MSARNTFVTQIIRGSGAIADAEKALLVKVNSLSFFGDRQTSGYFSGIVETPCESPEDSRDILKEVRPSYTDFSMAIVYDR